METIRQRTFEQPWQLGIALFLVTSLVGCVIALVTQALGGGGGASNAGAIVAAGLILGMHDARRTGRMLELRTRVRASAWFAACSVLALLGVLAVGVRAGDMTLSLATLGPIPIAIAILGGVVIALPLACLGLWLGERQGVKYARSASEPD